MSEQGKLRKMLQERRLQHQLEVQSRQIETVLSEHRVSAHVAGGYVQPRTIRFDLASHLETGLDRLRHIKQDLLTALGVAEGELIQYGERWQLHVSRPEEPPVSLLDLLSLLSVIPPMTIVLGLDEEGNPVLVELSGRDLSHILIAGTAVAGKSALLRTIALSLALTHKQSQLQMVVLDGSTDGNFEGYTSLEPLSFLPHMLGPVAYEREGYRELIDFLAAECAYRLEQQADWPKIVVLIDELTGIIASSGQEGVVEGITQLLQRGPEAGIHLIMTSSQPESEKLSSAFRLNLPVRLVGKTVNARQAAAAADVPGTQAEYLLGEGDFLAVVDGQATHFQAAYIGDYDLHLTVETLHRRRPQPLLAQPLDIRQLAISACKEEDSEVKAFVMTDAGVRVTDSSAGVAADGEQGA